MFIEWLFHTFMILLYIFFIRIVIYSFHFETSGSPEALAQNLKWFEPITLSLLKHCWYIIRYCRKTTLNTITSRCKIDIFKHSSCHVCVWLWVSWKICLYFYSTVHLWSISPRLWVSLSALLMVRVILCFLWENFSNGHAVMWSLILLWKCQRGHKNSTLKSHHFHIRCPFFCSF